MIFGARCSGWMRDGAVRVKFRFVGNRTVFLVAVGSFSLALLAGCNDDTAPDPNDEAFKAPLSTDLIVEADTSCTGNGAVSYGDTVKISGFDYLPDSVVDLRWTDLNTDDTSALDSVAAASGSTRSSRRGSTCSLMR